MATRIFHGRRDEQREFQDLLKARKSSLVVAYGRRRIGKSALVSHCGRSDAGHFFKFEGLAPREEQTREDQLQAFAGQLATQSSLPQLTLESWPQAFQLLESILPQKGKTVILLDEISWMGRGDKDFAGHLKTAWDNHFSARNNLVLVLCGSISSWIETNILKNTGFVGRCSWTFQLGPLPLEHCLKFWGKRGERISTAEKIRLLSITGGIPRYLEEIDPTKSAEQNIHRLCFNPGGLLFREFDDLFNDTFSRRSSRYRDICKALTGPALTVTELSDKLKVGRGGVISDALHELEIAGFLTSDTAFSPQTGRNLRAVKFRLSDPYLRFYLRYVEPQKKRIASGLYKKTPLENLPGWDSLMGLQFENLILTNLSALIRALDLKNTPVLNAAPYFQKQSAKKKACQIDLLLRTKRALYLVEIKLRDKITREVIDEVQEKATRLKLDSTQTLRTVLVYHGQLENSVAEEDYFDALMPFEKLLG